MNEILNELECIVGRPIINEEGKRDYTQLEWTQKDEEKFKEYLINLFKDKNIVKEVAKYPRLITNKKMRVKLADDFLFNFGPKTIYGDN